MHNIINIKSEMLFREAEDCFLYFNQITEAIEKIEEALKLTPNHIKSLNLKGDIEYINGNINNALNTYTKALENSPNDSKILGSIATCLDANEEYEKALSFCDKAFFFINKDNSQILQSLYELKISILLRLKKYTRAHQLIDEAKNILSIDEIINLIKHKEVINLKLKMKEKIKSSNLQVL